MPLSAADRLAISEVIARYCHATDDGDGERTAAQFTADGILEIAGAWQARGTEQIAEIGRIPNKPRHWVNSIVMEGNGSTAESTVYYAAIREGGDLLATGRYDSKLTKQLNGDWKLVHHRYTGDPATAPPRPQQADGKLTAADRVAILGLIARYNNAVDDREPEAWAETFVPDGQFEIVGGPTIAGRDSLADYVRSMPAPDSRHWTANTIIEGSAAAASVKCYLAMIGKGGIRITGRYADSVVNVDGTWIFERRAVTIDGMGGEQ